MDKKNTGIIATVVTALLCGCPGIFLCLFGALAAAGILPYTTELNGVTNTGKIPTSWGYAGLCISFIFILIPVLIGIFTLRKKSAEVVPEIPTVEPPPPSEPLPPAI